MKKIIVLLSVIFLTSCSHNQGTLIAGKGFILGGDGIKYFNGFTIIDNSRENSSWKVEIKDEDGITVQDGNIKGVKTVERRIDKQITGYLVDLSKENPEAVNEYLKTK